MEAGHTGVKRNKTLSTNVEALYSKSSLYRISTCMSKESKVQCMDSDRFNAVHVKRVEILYLHVLYLFILGL